MYVPNKNEIKKLIYLVKGDFIPFRNELNNIYSWCIWIVCVIDYQRNLFKTLKMNVYIKL